jgi:hypothetical protein
MRSLVLAFAACVIAGLPAHGRAQAAPADAPNGPAPPCRTTALTTDPQLFTQGDPTRASDSEALVERFYVAVACDTEHDPGDYQIWWKSSRASPAVEARLVAIIDEPADTCAAKCSEFEFFVEVNHWRMTPGCYGVRAIYGDAVDEYWQCTRAIVYTLSPQRAGAPSRD